MKIKKVTEEAIVFDNETVITYDHCQDCCEDNYADFKQIEPEALDYDFETELKFEAVIDDDLSNNDELQKEAEEAEQEIVEARRKILHASDTLRQIYNDCYED